MAISSVTAQGVVPLPLPGQGARTEANLPHDAASARVQGVDGQESVVAAVDKRSVAVNAQKSEARDEPDAKTVRDAVERVKKFVESAASDVQFSVDEDSGIRVIKVVDKETKEVIRQMPSKEVVELAKALDKLQGLIIKQTA
ncbi:MAG: flagellar protein FlaG [Azonexus sp.]|nr:flagellar protein FlaG [Betaproteobacteria bacterium]MBK8917114.1 flagellar protein FlaG [Betaproteobacteria bacterium]MBP6037440.1 flagellar protein FlaG [Azonexus sp.]MBP6908024.1 flagellar protein FlaG [Azonexus sp.]